MSKSFLNIKMQAGNRIKFSYLHILFKAFCPFRATVETWRFKMARSVEKDLLPM